MSSRSIRSSFVSRLLLAHERRLFLSAGETKRPGSSRVSDARDTARRERSGPDSSRLVERAPDEPRRAVLGPRLRVRDHPGLGAARTPPHLGGLRAVDARARAGLVGVVGVRVGDERPRPGRPARPAAALFLAMMLAFLVGAGRPARVGRGGHAVRARLRGRALPSPRAVRGRIAPRQRVVSRDRRIRDHGRVGMALLIAGAPSTTPRAPSCGRPRSRSTTPARPGSPASACAACSRSPSRTSPSATACSSSSASGESIIAIGVGRRAGSRSTRARSRA